MPSSMIQTSAFLVANLRFCIVCIDLSFDIIAQQIIFNKLFKKKTHINPFD